MCGSNETPNRIELVTHDQLSIHLFQNNTSRFVALIGITTGLVDINEDRVVENESSGMSGLDNVRSRARLQAIDQFAKILGEFHVLIRHDAVEAERLVAPRTDGRGQPVGRAVTQRQRFGRGDSLACTPPA